HLGHGDELEGRPDPAQVRMGPDRHAGSGQAGDHEVRLRYWLRREGDALAGASPYFLRLCVRTPAIAERAGGGREVRMSSLHIEPSVLFLRLATPLGCSRLVAGGTGGDRRLASRRTRTAPAPASGAAALLRGTRRENPGHWPRPRRRPARRERS